jgi:hypothetical protein
LRVAAARNRDERIAHLIGKLEDDYRNYSDSVLILSGLADYFQSLKSPARFIGTNLPLKRLDQPESQPPRPDLAVQAKLDTLGICFELKWSLPQREENLKRELVSCERYSQPRSGWRTQDGTIPSVEVLLVVPRNDCSRVRELINKDTSVNSLFSGKASLLSWDFSHTTGRERMYVLKILGAASAIDSMFVAPGFEIDRNALTQTFAKFHFYGARPPLHYIMDKVYYLANATKWPHDVLVDVEIRARTTHRYSEGILVTARELHAEQAGFFPPWERADQEIPQIRLGWIQDALVGLVHIGMAIPVITIRYIDKAGAVFMRRSKDWEHDYSQQFFVPTRRRGLDLRYHIIRSYARFLVDQELKS